MNRHRLLRPRFRDINNRPPQQYKTRRTEEPENTLRGRPQHGSQQSDVSLLNLAERDRKDLVHGVPEDGVGKWVAAGCLAEVAESEGGKAGAEGGHAVDVALLWDEAAVVLAPPAERAFTLGRLLIAVEAPEGWADDAVLGPEDVGEREAPVDEGVGGEDVGGDNTDWFGVGGVQGGFGDEGGDDGFDEDVEAVDQEGGDFGVA